MFGEDLTFSNSWYSYMGSDTEPPCNEEVQWFVMRDRFVVQQLTLDSLKKVVLNSNQINSRKTFPQLDREVIYHSQCKIFKSTTIEADLPPVIPDATFVEAKTVQHHYAIAHPLTKTIFDVDQKPIVLNRGKNL